MPTPVAAATGPGRKFGRSKGFPRLGTFLRAHGSLDLAYGTPCGFVVFFFGGLGKVVGMNPRGNWGFKGLLYIYIDRKAADGAVYYI